MDALCRESSRSRGHAGVGSAPACVADVAEHFRCVGLLCMDVLRCDV